MSNLKSQYPLKSLFFLDNLGFAYATPNNTGTEGGFQCSFPLGCPTHPPTGLRAIRGNEYNAPNKNLGNYLVKGQERLKARNILQGLFLKLPVIVFSRLFSLATLNGNHVSVGRGTSILASKNEQAHLGVKDSRMLSREHQVTKSNHSTASSRGCIGSPHPICQCDVNKKPFQLFSSDKREEYVKRFFCACPQEYK